jgi:hypothetical protein
MMSLEALTASEKWPCRLTQSFTVGPISLQGRLIQPSLTEINFCKTRGYSDFAPGQTGCLRKRPSRLFIRYSAELTVHISVKLVYSNFLPPNFLPFLLFLYLAFSGFSTLPERFFGDPTGIAGLGSSNHDDQPYLLASRPAGLVPRQTSDCPHFSIQSQSTTWNGPRRVGVLSGTRKLLTNCNFLPAHMICLQPCHIIT